MTNKLEELTSLVTQFRDERDWKQFHTVKDMFLSLMLEAGELVEHSQWKSEQEFREKLGETRGEVGEELADILYWLLLISHDLGIDLEEAFLRKLEKNRKKYPIETAKGNSQKYSSL